MIAGMRVTAGSLLQIRTEMTREEMRRRPADVWFGPVIRLGPEFRRLENVAYIEAAQADGMKKSGWRHLTLWAEAAKQNVIAVIDTESADGQRMAYRILDASGAVLARVVRIQGSVTGFRRTRWTVEITGGPTLHAVKGSVFGWCVWWALSPLWAVLSVTVLFADALARMPLTTVFTSGDGELFRYSTVSGTDHDFAVTADWPDPRVLFALTALHNSHLSWRDKPAMSPEEHENHMRGRGIVRQ